MHHTTIGDESIFDMLLASKKRNKTTHNAPNNTPDGFADPMMPEHVSAPSKHTNKILRSHDNK